MEGKCIVLQCHFTILTCIVVTADITPAVAWLPISFVHLCTDCTWQGSSPLWAFLQVYSLTSPFEIGTTVLQWTKGLFPMRLVIGGSIWNFHYTVCTCKPIMTIIDSNQSHHIMLSTGTCNLLTTYKYFSCIFWLFLLTPFLSYRDTLASSGVQGAERD